MARRKPYTRVLKKNQIREDHVNGMGDTLFIGFQCLNAKCKNILFIKKSELSDEFEFICPECGFIFRNDESTKFYDYKLENTTTNEIVEEGEFTIYHYEYINEAKEFKYCIVCNSIKPAELFDTHNSRRSGLQGECRLCKKQYNAIKNQTRISDQHREAAQKRRLYIELSGNDKIDSKAVFERFSYKCFNCGKKLDNVIDEKERPLDHTLPAYNLWPLTTQNATLLCQACNGKKSGKWPSAFYSVLQIKKLSVITGIPYDHLNGEAFYNPDALEKLKDPDIVDGILIKYSKYIDELIKLRNRILKETEIDFFLYSKSISQKWVVQADSLLGNE